MGQLRTVVIGPTGFPFGSPSWPVAQPDDDLDYAIDVTAPLADIDDTIASVAVSAAPSGEGELVIGNVVVSDNYCITVQLSGGIAGRQYVVRFEVGTDSGCTFAWLVTLRIDPSLATYPIAPPSDGFGEPAEWNGGDGSGGDTGNGQPSLIVVTGRKYYSS